MDVDNISEFEEKEEEWEEEIVMVNLEGTVSFSIKEGSMCKFLGLDTQNPILEIDGHIFSGEYKDAIGTQLFFTHKEDAAVYEYKTHKLLNMQKVVVMEKSNLETMKDEQPATENSVS